MTAPLDCRALLFDLDGALVDSAPDLWGAMNHVLIRHNFAPLPLERVRHLVGHGARALLARGFWGDGAESPLNDPEFEVAVTEFLEYYRLHLTDHSVPFPHVSTTLARLTDLGFAMAVVTNKPEMLARLMLEQLDLMRFFSVVVGGDTLPVRKPDPGPLFYALKQLGVPTAQGVMLGDSETDLQAARNARIPVILFSYGYNRGIDVRDLGPDHVADHFDQLPNLLHSLQPSRTMSTCHN
ncbi:MAG: phosphoglycolate phosphatase [Magnetococcales bacterium]|nr:phosphoglycolate phosphatase [Magnetococcales bacterium]MBF0439499.1 phosphoglycolate phosphatase [Magnetococcales bacterium]